MCVVVLVLPQVIMAANSFCPVSETCDLLSLVQSCANFLAPYPTAAAAKKSGIGNEAIESLVLVINHV